MNARKAMPRLPARPAHQSGIMLLEVLIAILIFSFGVLAIVGLQSASARESSNAKYKADATLLIDELVGRMWTTPAPRNTATLAPYATGGAQFANWLAWAQSSQGLGTAVDTANTASTLATDVAVCGSRTKASVTLAWRLPNESAATPSHRVSFVTCIS